MPFPCSTLNKFSFNVGHNLHIKQDCLIKANKEINRLIDKTIDISAVKAMIFDDNAQETHGIEKLRLLTGKGNVLTEKWLKNQAWKQLFSVELKGAHNGI